jgi:hypothetical protein
MAWPPDNAGAFGQGYRFSIDWVNSFIDKLNEYNNRLPVIGHLEPLGVNELIRPSVLKTKLSDFSNRFKLYINDDYMWIREGAWTDASLGGGTLVPANFYTVQDMKDLVTEPIYDLIFNRKYLSKDYWNGVYQLINNVFKYYFSNNQNSTNERHVLQLRNTAPFYESYNYNVLYPSNFQPNSGVYESTAGTSLTGDPPADLKTEVDSFLDNDVPLLVNLKRDILYNFRLEDREDRLDDNSYTRTSQANQLFRTGIENVALGKRIGVYKPTNNYSVPEVKIAYRVDENHEAIDDLNTENFPTPDITYGTYIAGLTQVNAGDDPVYAFMPYATTVSAGYTLFDTTITLNDLKLPTVPSVQSIALPIPPQTSRFEEQGATVKIDAVRAYYIMKMVDL